MDKNNWRNHILSIQEKHEEQIALNEKRKILYVEVKQKLIEFKSQLMEDYGVLGSAYLQKIDRETMIGS